ncbi:MAG TPA: mannose-6-phosphate isomerase, class I [Jiangellales bacterium]|nr:mannose-6-phosphate isomerase, class I [Jiangellales bacterium]
MGAVHAMDNPVRAYAWGSLTALSELAGRPPSGEPEAELWMGAHPGSPSLVGGRSLGELVAEDPHRVLGPELVERSGSHLPFLLKVLGVGSPLSLQVHPSAEQAGAGFADEERLGVPWNAANRTYRDPFAKPELVVALTDFDAVCGFRPAGEARGLVGTLAAPRLAPLLADLAAADPVEGLTQAFARLVTWPVRDRPALVAEAARAAAGGPGCEPYAWLVRLAELYPGDPGALAPLLLSTVRLAPGEGLLLGPGVPHAYLRGTAVEVMGASDNVLRAGLTTKHVDVQGLLDTVRVNRAPVPLLNPAAHGPEEVWPSDGVPDFRLSRVQVAPGDDVVLDRRGPQILVCVRGAVEVSAGDSALTLRSGASAFVEAVAPEVTLRGDGVVFRATAGPDS